MPLVLLTYYLERTRMKKCLLPLPLVLTIPNLLLFLFSFWTLLRRRRLRRALNRFFTGFWSLGRLLVCFICASVCVPVLRVRARRVTMDSYCQQQHLPACCIYLRLHPWTGTFSSGGGSFSSGGGTSSCTCSGGSSFTASWIFQFTMTSLVRLVEAYVFSY